MTRRCGSSRNGQTRSMAAALPRSRTTIPPAATSTLSPRNRFRRTSPRNSPGTAFAEYVMPALVAGIHVFLAGSPLKRRAWPGQARPRLHKWFDMSGTRATLGNRSAVVSLHLHVHIDELLRLADVLEESPAFHPREGAFHLVARDRRRIDHIDTAFAQIVDGKPGDLGVGLVVVYEIVEVGALVRVDAAHRLPHRAVERAVGLGIDPIRCHLGTVMEGRDDDPAALLFRERDIGLGQGRRLDVAAHEQVETITRAVRHAAKFDLLAGNKT